MKSNGHIPEGLYNRLGFPNDTNYACNKVEKANGISQETRHRAKILRHTLQSALRKKKEDNAFVEVKRIKTMH